MKKIICFILGLIIGAAGVFYFGDSLKDAEVPESISALLNKIQGSDDNVREESEKEEKEEHTDYNGEDEWQEEVAVTPHLNYKGYYGDDIGFPVPPEDMLDPYAEGNSIIYDMQENGKGVLINYYSVGMNQCLATVYVTSDYGESWKAVQSKMHFLSGGLNVVYIGDTIAIIHSDSIYLETKIHISNDNGKTFNEKTGEPISFAQLIGVPDGEYMMAYPVILSRDRENNTVVCAWFRTAAWTPGSEIFLISEHDTENFEITKEFFRNKTAIDEELYYLY